MASPRDDMFAIGQGRARRHVQAVQEPDAPHEDKNLMAYIMRRHYATCKKSEQIFGDVVPPVPVMPNANIWHIQTVADYHQASWDILVSPAEMWMAEASAEYHEALHHITKPVRVKRAAPPKPKNGTRVTVAAIAANQERRVPGSQASLLSSRRHNTRSFRVLGGFFSLGHYGPIEKAMAIDRIDMLRLNIPGKEQPILDAMTPSTPRQRPKSLQPPGAPRKTASRRRFSLQPERLEFGLEIEPEPQALLRPVSDLPSFLKRDSKQLDDRESRTSIMIEDMTRRLRVLKVEPAEPEPAVGVEVQDSTVEDPELLRAQESEDRVERSEPGSPEEAGSESSLLSFRRSEQGVQLDRQALLDPQSR